MYAYGVCLSQMGNSDASSQRAHELWFKLANETFDSNMVTHYAHHWKWQYRTPKISCYCCHRCVSYRPNPTIRHRCAASLFFFFKHTTKLRGIWIGFVAHNRILEVTLLTYSIRTCTRTRKRTHTHSNIRSVAFRLWNELSMHNHAEHPPEYAGRW